MIALLLACGADEPEEDAEDTDRVGLGGDDDDDDDTDVDDTDTDDDGPLWTGGPIHLLVADRNTTSVLRVNEKGAVQDGWSLPVANVGGVAYDADNRGSFWASSADGSAAIVRIDMSNGVVMDNVTPPALIERRGLDFLDLDAPALVSIGTNLNSVDVTDWIDIATGDGLAQGSFHNGGFVSGIGSADNIEVVPPAAGDVRQALWVTVGTTELQLWSAIGTAQTVVSLPSNDGAGAGIVALPDGTFWIGAGDQLLNLDSAGAALAQFTLDGADIRDLSWMPATD